MSQPRGLQRTTSNARFSPRLAPPAWRKNIPATGAVAGLFRYCNGTARFGTAPAMSRWCNSVRCRFPRLEGGLSQPLLRHSSAEPKPVPVGIDDRHLASLPLRVAGRLGWRNATAANLAKQSIDVVHHEIRGASGLAVAAVLGQEEREAVASELGKDGQAGLESMLPIHSESQAIHVEGTRPLPVGHSQLGEDSLTHCEGPP